MHVISDHPVIYNLIKIRIIRQPHQQSALNTFSDTATIRVMPVTPPLPVRQHAVRYPSLQELIDEQELSTLSNDIEA